MEHHEETHEKITTDILVVGAGIAGISAALEAAETGYEVVLIEKSPFIGGRVSQLNQYFPKLCPPTCGLEINLRRLKDNPKIKLLTLADIHNIDGKTGNYKIKMGIKPRYVNNRCTLCGDCVAVCPVDRDNTFNFNIDKNKAIYINYENAYPQKYVIDGKVCKGESCNACVEVCKYEAIDLNQKSEFIEINAKSIVWATGWDPYDATKMENLGFGKLNGVITNMMMERLTSPTGPTGGKLELPNYKKALNKIAFVQCAGSRDENHLEYCSSICCLASMKQAQYVREQYPEAEIHIFYIDLRANGILEDFYKKTLSDPKIFYHRGKVAKVIESPNNQGLIVEAEDTMLGRLNQFNVDLVVLATGMKPNVPEKGVQLNPVFDENGFVNADNEEGYIGCGVATGPKEVSTVVQEATSAVMKAINQIKGRN